MQRRMKWLDFRVRLAIRVGAIAGTVALFVFMLGQPNLYFAAALVGAGVVGLVIELHYYVTQTNRKLTRFLESIRYSDFITGFNSDNSLGNSFRDLNTALNQVLEAFRKARAEKEENVQFLNTIVQQVGTGIMTIHATGDIQLMNTNAKKFLASPYLKNIHELRATQPLLYQIITELRPGKSQLYRPRHDLLLTLQALDIRIHGQTLRLITLQNIISELQQQELDAWQNLTRVLRHEIMNSITPISSLTSTLRDILEQELVKRENDFELTAEAAADLKEGLATIENRSRGLIQFIDAYREYTSVPQPRLREMAVAPLFERVVHLMKPYLRDRPLQIVTQCDPSHLTVMADEEQIEQVLINLVKNAQESLGDQPHGRIELIGRLEGQAVVIEVIDNGPGIIPEALGKIFIPFFSTKKTGSGIGLSLSRQIMQMHKGALVVDSRPHERTAFQLRF